MPKNILATRTTSIKTKIQIIALNKVDLESLPLGENIPRSPVMVSAIIAGKITISIMTPVPEIIKKATIRMIVMSKQIAKIAIAVMCLSNMFYKKNKVNSFEKQW
ncbi:hypothetical protein AD998_21645 [bacterium 336/3]|nr:hypothetical protein AD998_21645 [bacterium 336/3]